MKRKRVRRLWFDEGLRVSAGDVVQTLDQVAHERGRVPDFVRFDNGLEFVAHAVADWCHTSGTEIYRSGFALVERLD